MYEILFLINIFKFLKIKLKIIGFDSDLYIYRIQLLELRCRNHPVLIILDLDKMH